MKTKHSTANVVQFLVDNEQAIPESVRQLVEGHVSQAFSFETAHGKFVCRLAPDDGGFKADQFAFTHYADRLPIPEVFALDAFDAKTYYCVTSFLEGKTAVSLALPEMEAALPAVHDVLATIYLTDISSTTGYGQIDSNSGNAKHSSWRQKLDQIQKHGRQTFKSNAISIGLPGGLADKFFDQYETNIEAASENRRLFHGDPGFDNILIRDGQVSGIIDWAQMGYGDWMCDFARLDFWAEGVYGDALTFAKRYGLEYENLEARKALYWATNALWAIEFADKARSEKVTQWLHDNLESKLL